MPGRLTLCIATVSLGVAAYAATALHAVRFDTLVRDAGSYKEGQIARATFHFRNDGHSAAAIISVVPACGVMASLVTGGTVAPGDDGEVEVRMDTSGQQGPIAGTVAVTLRDPFKRTILLTLQATVAREFVVASPMVDFGTITGAGPSRRELRIRLNSTEHRILTARSTDDAFGAHVASSRLDGAIVAVRTRRQAQQGLRFGTIRIATSSPHMPELIVPVRAMVAGPP